MGLLNDLRDAVRRTLAASPPPPESNADGEPGPVEPSHALRPARSAVALASELHAEYPEGVPTDVLFDRAEAARLDVQAVDRVLDGLREAARVKVRRVKVDGLRVLDLAPLDSVRTRIKGSAYWVTDGERKKYGGPEYLLIREPENEADASAVAVYGNGRKVGHISAASAARLAPLLDQLDADAFRVTGAGTTQNSMVLWVDVPKTDALRRFVRAQD